jgi:serine/threonine-protein kinase
VGGHPAFADVLRALTHDRLAELLTARPLSLEETTAMVSHLMGQRETSEEFAGFAYRRTKGKPGLIAAIVGSLGGRLELQGEIGAGSTGRVFRAFDRQTDTMVAAKLVLAREGIDLGNMLRFQQEAAILRALDHPNIVRIYDTFAEEHAACIIMELLDGNSLSRQFQDGRLSLERSKHIAACVANALAHAHSQSIVHRDIKPDNVMLVADDRVKVTDFGIARILRVDNSLGTLATTGMRAGTPSYMAPEQISGKEIDGRADVYALGAMLFHMVTGRPPFEGDDKLAIAVKHLQDQPVAPSSITPYVSPAWDAVILRALQKDPRKRF